MAAIRLGRALRVLLLSLGIAGLPLAAHATTPASADRAKGKAKAVAVSKKTAKPQAKARAAKASPSRSKADRARARPAVKPAVAKAAVATAAVATAAAATAAAAAAPAPHASTVELCTRFVPRLPGVTKAECESSGLQPTGTLSRKGLPILAREIPPVHGKAAKPLRVLLLGGIHGDELTASAIVFEWMQWMTRPIAGSFHWRVAPIVNPDGLLAPKPTRVNASGVDINRNFPTPDWHRDAPKYWAKTTGSDPRRYPGKAPLSEPESQWVNAEIERFKPDVIISVHAPFGVLDFDGPAPVPQRFGQLRFNRVGVYPGSLGNYHGLYKNTPVITLELPNALAMPPQAEVQRIWADMLTWIRRNVEDKPVLRRTSG